MMKKAKKQSPKKGNPLELASQYLLTAEYKEKMTALHVERWSKNLAALKEELDTFDKLLATKSSLRLVEVNKNFGHSKSLLAKTSKELETAQKQSAKTQAEFEESFEAPFLEGLFSSQSEPESASTRDTINKIKGILGHSSHTLSGLAQDCQNFQAHMTDLEDALNALFLPEQIQEANSQSEALNQRLETIYRTMATLTVDSPYRNPRNIEESFLPLSTAHSQEASWLRQIRGLVPTALMAATTTAPTPDRTETSQETDAPVNSPPRP